MELNAINVNIMFIFYIVSLTILCSHIGLAIIQDGLGPRDIATGARNPSYRALISSNINNYDHINTSNSNGIGIGISQQQQQQQNTVNQIEQKPSIDPSARIGLYQALMEMESRPTENLQECAQWFEANANYEYLLNEAQARLRVRPRQAAKKQECDAMNESWQQTKALVDKFKRLLDDPQTRADPNPVLDLFDQIDATIQQQRHLNEFIVYMHSDGVQEKLRQLEEVTMQPVVSSSVPISTTTTPTSTTTTTTVFANGMTEKLDEVQELDQAIRMLIDREETNTESDINSLSDMSDMMQETLASGRIKLGSPRFKYLAATVDAAYEVVDLWHAKPKLNGNHQSELNQTPPMMSNQMATNGQMTPIVGSTGLNSVAGGQANNIIQDNKQG